MARRADCGVGKWITALAAALTTIGVEMIDTTADFISSLDDPTAAPQVEILVNKKTGRARQAGASQDEGELVELFRSKCEGSLYSFCKGILGLTRLTKNLHREVCRRAQKIPPYRKLFLLPRDHLKTSIFSRGMPIHMLIQPKERNVYRPSQEGSSTRILLSNETSTNAEHFLRWIEGRYEACELLRALWPHRVWEDPRKESKKWNEKEMTVPRIDDYPEASIETIGVGGAITSRHYDVLIKDDLVSIEAANSPLVMYDAIEWHKTSRALMDSPDTSLEFIVGTRWAALDIYQYIINEDPSVEPYVRSAFEDGEPIFPEIFNANALNQIQREMGPVMFSLLYMNSAVNPELVDFSPDDLRYYTVSGENIIVEEDERDVMIRADINRKKFDATAVANDVRGMPFNSKTYDLIVGGRAEYFRAKAK